MRRPLLDPRLHAVTETHWPSVCTIETPVIVTSGSGQEYPSGTSPVLGLRDLSCRMAPLNYRTPADGEDITSAIIEGKTLRNLKINGYFPDIEARTMVAIVDGVEYSIRTVEADSQMFCTRLKLEIVEPLG